MPLFGANLFAANTAATTTTPVANPQPAAEPQPIALTPAEPQPIALTPAEPQPAAPIETAAQPAPAVTPAEGAAAPTEATQPTAPKAQTKTEPAPKPKYVAPASPQEAHDRIEEAATAIPAKVTKQPVGDQYIFGGKTFALRQAFTMLGGTFDQTTQSWSISVERYDNPALCQDTFDAEIARNERRNERIEAHKEEIEAIRAEMRQQFDRDLLSRGTEAIRQVIAEDIAKARKDWEQERTPAGMITIADAQAATKKALQMMLAALSKTPDQTLDAIIKKAYSA